jgi:hypothetical protein
LSEGDNKEGERNVGDALRDAIERTLSATAGSASATRERAGELVDEVVKLGLGARRELEKRLGREGGGGASGESEDPNSKDEG